MTSRALGIPPLVWLGQRSYGLYLYHWPIYQLIRNIAGKQMKFHEFVIAMGITIVITELSYRYIETPIRKGALGRWWKQIREARDDPAAATRCSPERSSARRSPIFGVTSLATAELKQNDVQPVARSRSGVDVRRARRPDVRAATTPQRRSGRPTRPPATTVDPLVDPTQTVVARDDHRDRRRPPRSRCRSRCSRSATR